MEELADFIQSNLDPRELKRALAVQMAMQNYTYSQAGEVFQVFIGLTKNGNLHF
jgi:hypothetical protein